MGTFIECQPVERGPAAAERYVIIAVKGDLQFEMAGVLSQRYTGSGLVLQTILQVGTAQICDSIEMTFVITVLVAMHDNARILSAYFLNH